MYLVSLKNGQTQICEFFPDEQKLPGFLKFWNVGAIVIRDPISFFKNGPDKQDVLVLLLESTFINSSEVHAISKLSPEVSKLCADLLDQPLNV